MKTNNIWILATLVFGVMTLISCTEDSERDVMLPLKIWEEIRNPKEGGASSQEITYATLAYLLKNNGSFSVALKNVQNNEIDSRLQEDRQLFDRLVETNSLLNNEITTRLDYDEDNGENSPNALYGLFLPETTVELSSGTIGYTNLGLTSKVNWGVTNLNVTIDKYDGKTFGDFFNKEAPVQLVVPVLEEPKNTNIESFILEMANINEETKEVDSYVVVPYNEFLDKFYSYQDNTPKKDAFGNYDSNSFIPIVVGVVDDMFSQYENSIIAFRDAVNAYENYVNQYVDVYETALSNYYNHLVSTKFSFLKNNGGIYRWGKDHYMNNTEHFTNEDDWAISEWGKNWETPRASAFQELLDLCQWTEINDNYGIKGWKIVGPNGKAIFLPMVKTNSNIDALQYGYMTNDRRVSSDWTGFIYGFYYKCFNSRKKWLSETAIPYKEAELFVRPIHQ